ncbi:MAG: ABC transporter ATP-binding protein [Phenylobacterium sp.]|nr:ABC transporter ATP-binding protein [Phenylobacterium sp.]
MTPLLELRQVSRRFGARTVVDAASLKLFPGRIACLLGPSGCGKSTLLRMIAGLETPDLGEIHIGDRVVASPAGALPPEDRGIGLVFQDNALFPHLDVQGNVGFGLTGLSRADRTQKVLRLLDQFQIRRLASEWPHSLSGGEQQRVAIARALARTPSLLLLDEPFSGLDGVLRESVRGALLEDLRRLGTTVLVVTHDPEEAMAIADDLILMSEGRILQAGPPEDVYRRPVSLIAARLLGEMVVVPGEVASGRIETPLGSLTAPGLADGSAQLGLRPEALVPAEAGVVATVLDRRFQGDGYRLTLDLGEVQVPLTWRADPPEPGATVCVSFRPADAVLFNPEGERAVSGRLPSG